MVVVPDGDSPAALEVAALQTKLYNTIAWLGFITLLHTLSDIASSAGDPWAARLQDFYLEALPVPFVLALGYFGTKHRDATQLKLYMVAAAWRMFDSAGVAFAYFFEQEEQCSAGAACSDPTMTCTGNPSFVCKSRDEIEACEIDPACSMDDIGGGLKDHPMEAVTMIVVVGLFVISLLSAVPMLAQCDAGMRKIS
eukprot:COSAG02_NODE_1200_length_13909_cov_15.541202_10_plen_196_part_00